jgi:hypothetical protein
MPKPRPSQAVQKTWFEAYKQFLTSRDESLGLKLLPLAALGIVPVAVADEIIPFIGMLDDIPTALLVGFIAWRTWLRVKTYR